MSTSLAAAAKKKNRASIACCACHAKKTACDLSQTTPAECTKCRKLGGVCTLFESKRGKYVRRPAANSTPPVKSASTESSIMAIESLLNFSLQDIISTPFSTSPDLFDALPMPPTMSDTPARNDVLSDEAAPSAGWVDLMKTPFSCEEHTDSVFASELFTLSHVLRESWAQQGGKEDVGRVHFASIPLRGTTLSIEQLQYLSTSGCFTLPSKEVLDALITSYFDHFHPVYPVINKTEFLAKYANIFSGGCSLLLIWGILYVSSTICPEHVLQAAGLSSRFSALETFYHRGHALFSLGFEKDATTVVQFLFLLSNIWSGGEDSYHWASKAVSHSMALGMHRTTISSQLPTGVKRLWRRIFWSVYIRDRHSAAATGRPYRISDHFCDTPIPIQSEFDDGEDCELFVQAIRLAQILGDVIDIRLGVNLSEIDLLQRQSECFDRFQLWQLNLQPRYQYSGSYSGNPGQAFLHLSYHCWVIHLYRPSSSSSSTNIIASKAAACIARHFEDLLQNGMVLGTPQFGTTALFAAMGQLVWDRKFESESSMKQIGASQLAILALAAKELSTARPVASWFRLMFLSLNSPPVVAIPSLSLPSLSSTFVNRFGMDKVLGDDEFLALFSEVEMDGADLFQGWTGSGNGPVSLETSWNY